MSQHTITALGGAETRGIPQTSTAATNSLWQSAAAAQHFIGRKAEIDSFRTALRHIAPSVQVISVHGPGGIGKTALLQRFALEAWKSGRKVVQVDARLIEPTEEAFAAAAWPGDVQRPVLLVDSFELIQSLEARIRDRFLVGLPTGSLVVLAGRNPLHLSWRADLLWADALRTLTLGGLSPADSLRMVQAAGADPAVYGPLMAFAGGHPLALRLGTQNLSESTGRDPWSLPPAAVRSLWSSLVGAVPSAAHQRALEVCAHALNTTEDLLHAVLPEHAEETFTWLRDLSYVEQDRFGIHPITVVREVVDRDFRWRAPERYLAMHRAVRIHLEKLIGGVSEPSSLHAAAAYNFVQSRGTWFTPVGPPDTCGQTYETEFGAEDAREVIELAERTQGNESAALVEFWLRRQPETFRLYRSAGTGQLLGFLALLRFDRWDAAEVVIDPVVAAVRESAEATAGLRQGEHLLALRFLVHAPDNPVPAAALARITREVLRAQHLAWLFVILDSPKTLEPLLRFADLHLAPVTAAVAGRPLALFCRDWRDVHAGEWADLLDNRMLFGPRALQTTNTGPLTVLSRSAFDRAVHDALRSWYQREQFALNPLLNAGLVVRSGSSDREGVLRDLLTRAVEAVDEDPAAKRLREVLWSTYMTGGNTQAAVARELSLSFSTYRRHLKRALEKVCWYLWQQEIARGTEPRRPAAASEGPASEVPFPEANSSR